MLKSFLDLIEEATTTLQIFLLTPPSIKFLKAKIASPSADLLNSFVLSTFISTPFSNQNFDH